LADGGELGTADSPRVGGGEEVRSPVGEDAGPPVEEVVLGLDGAHAPTTTTSAINHIPMARRIARLSTAPVDAASWATA